MKFLFVLCAACLFGCASEIIVLESPDRNISYSIAPQPETAARGLTAPSKPNRYYINGDPKLERVSTGAILVGFADDADIEAFAAKYSLKNPRRISRTFNSWAFDNDSAIDDASLAAKIAAETPNLRYAKPDWVADIKLK